MIDLERCNYVKCNNVPCCESGKMLDVWFVNYRIVEL